LDGVEEKHSAVGTVNVGTLVAATTHHGELSGHDGQGQSGTGRASGTFERSNVQRCNDEIRSDNGRRLSMTYWRSGR
jgi:hypothetical protein